MDKGLRQTGRTTRLLQEAVDRDLPFVVNRRADKEYCCFLIRKGAIHLPPGHAPKIICLTESTEHTFRGMSNVVVDHAVWEFGVPERLRHLVEYLRYVCQPPVLPGMDEKDNTIALLRKKLEDSERKVEILNTALENAWSVQDNQQERIKELELTITSLEMRISNQANYLQAGHKQVDELEETVNRITAERDLARSALDDVKEALKKAYAERDELKESGMALAQKTIRLEDENQKLHELNVQIDAVNTNLKAENEELERNREILRCALDAELAKQKPVDYRLLESTRRANYNLTKVNSDLQNRIKQVRDILNYAPPPA